MLLTDYLDQSVILMVRLCVEQLVDVTTLSIAALVLTVGSSSIRPISPPPVKGEGARRGRPRPILALVIVVAL